MDTSISTVYQLAYEYTHTTLTYRTNSLIVINSLMFACRIGTLGAPERTLQPCKRLSRRLVEASSVKSDSSDSYRVIKIWAPAYRSCWLDEANNDNNNNNLVAIIIAC